ncbi:MAG: adenosylcobinamide kinase / adenosylcobinamide-phosphate guanylyltransferase [Pseudonocardiales bacterium]|jgi:adenosylcobinamide kinase/adenosylcobinamide-phosphate guanylyltransferase|nr:adenosylcobinamide kinase / adenosylcobinamide-phosphate guanylyltransferase [Pseudonocardiales bacterium]
MSTEVDEDPRRVLVLGGARSGKSAFAESVLSTRVAVQYVATAPAVDDDPEWIARVAEHRARRPPTWSTLESRDLATVCRASDAGAALIDSITAWLTATLDTHRAWQDDPGWRLRVASDVTDLTDAWSGSGRTLVAVSDEVGSGIVPESAAGRMFRDELGSLNQRLAAAADEVWLVTAGIPCRLR